MAEVMGETGAPQCVITRHGIGGQAASTLAAFPDHPSEPLVSGLNIHCETHSCRHSVAHVYMALYVPLSSTPLQVTQDGGLYLLFPLNPPGQQRGDLGKCLWASIQHITVWGMSHQPRTLLETADRCEAGPAHSLILLSP